MFFLFSSFSLFSFLFFFFLFSSYAFLLFLEESFTTPSTSHAWSAVRALTFLSFICFYKPRTRSIIAVHRYLRRGTRAPLFAKDPKLGNNTYLLHDLLRSISHLQQVPLYDSSHSHAVCPIRSSGIRRVFTEGNEIWMTLIAEGTYASQPVVYAVSTYLVSTWVNRQN